MNVLMLAICYQGVAFPVLFTMLPKAGNSSWEERVELMERFKSLFGEDSIERLTADREFIGQQWFGYLNDSGTKYYIRIKEGQYVTDPRSGNVLRLDISLTRCEVVNFVHIVGSIMLVLNCAT